MYMCESVCSDRVVDKGSCTPESRDTKCNNNNNSSSSNINSIRRSSIGNSSSNWSIFSF